MRGSSAGSSLGGGVPSTRILLAPRVLLLAVSAGLAAAHTVPTGGCNDSQKQLTI